MLELAIIILVAALLIVSIRAVRLSDKVYELEKDPCTHLRVHGQDEHPALDFTDVSNTYSEYVFIYGKNVYESRIDVVRYNFRTKEWEDKDGKEIDFILVWCYVPNYLREHYLDKIKSEIDKLKKFNKSLI